MKQKSMCKIIGIAIITTLLISSFSVFGMQMDNSKQKKQISKTERPYDGYLRVYVVEPVSRWDNYDGDPYHFGFLDFAIDEELSIDYQDTYTKQVTWNAQQAGYSNVEEQNIMVIASVFNPASEIRYAYPPSTNPFDAYFVDASAAVVPGEAGYNFANETFSHTVFCEEGTATWCQYCPGAAENLYTVYQSGGYPFYFVALIKDKVQKAASRLLNDYNLYGYPTSFFDGGYKVVVGASSVNTFKNRVRTCGQRDVHEMNLTISLVWAGSGILDMEITITNNELMPNIAPYIPDINGPTSGSPGIEYDYTVVTTDPDGDDVYYWIEWADGTPEEWIGPYSSGEEITVSHTWDERGIYTLKVKAKDTFDHESDYATLEVTMPRNRAMMTSLFLKFLQNHPHIFPVLRQLLRL